MGKMNRKNSTLIAAATAIGSYAFLRRTLRRRWNFRGKVVIITGGTRGLGFVLAREFLSRGARVSICGRSETTLQSALQAIAPLGDAFGMACDIRYEDQARRFIAATLERYGGIDVVVNNAGIISVGPLDSMTLEDYRDAMDTHFWGPLYLILAALPELRRSKGRIVNIASIGGIISPPHLIPYNASKFALVGLSEGLHSELAGEGIAVTTVCPGLMRTGSPQNAWFKGRNQAEYAWFNVSATSPFSSMSARGAARAIVNACAHAKPFVVLSPQAQFGAFMHNVFPGITARLLSKVARLLPDNGGVGRRRTTGSQSESLVTKSWMTALGRNAARAFNQNLSSPEPKERTTRPQ